MSVGSSSREDYLLTKRKVDDLNAELSKLKGQVCTLSTVQDFLWLM